MIFQNIFQKVFGLPMNKQYNDNSNKIKNDDDKDKWIMLNFTLTRYLPQELKRLQERLFKIIEISVRVFIC